MADGRDFHCCLVRPSNYLVVEWDYKFMDAVDFGFGIRGVVGNAIQCIHPTYWAVEFE